MAMPRESAFLPTIKCSLCGNQVEISMMGEHLCEESSATPQVLPSTSYGGFDDAPRQSSSLTEKYGQQMPPPVDTGVANLQPSRYGDLTPGSYSGESLSVSPLTPSGRSFPGRSDDHYSPRIASDEPTTPLASQYQRPGGYGGFGDQEANYVTRSPEKPAGRPFMQRMDTAASGPFETDRRPSHPGNAFPRRKESMVNRSEVFQAPPRPATANPAGGNGSADTVAPPRMPRQNGYGGFGPPQQSDDAHHLNASPGPMNRSETFPRPSLPPEPPLRTPSAPGTRPSNHRSRPSMGPDTSRAPPPRRSLVRINASKKGSVDLAAEFGIGNPYHTPSDSASSGYSNFSSHLSESSFQTSPARSQPNRKPSDAGNIDDLMDDLQASMEGLGGKDLKVDSTAARAIPPPPLRSPLFGSPLSTSPRDRFHGSPTQSDVRDAVSPLTTDRLAVSPRFASSPQQDSGFFGGQLKPAAPAAPRTGNSPPSPPRSAFPVRTTSRDPGNPSISRGDCKACGLAITGKSISSADGRLTGKYHKACFTCATCFEPFTSAEFYVLDDKPYCERHYHKLNGSLCGSCCQGIEGQYLEDEESTKYHVGCFRCLDCGRSLSDGYFEFDKKSYCERDAVRRMQRQDAEARGPPPRSASGHAPSPRPVKGLPGRPGPRGPPVMGRPPFGAPPGGRPFAGLPPPPKMNKRMTRLGNM